MKPSSSNSRSKGHAKARRKTREELDQEARDRKRQKKRRGHAPGSRAAGGNTTSGSKGRTHQKIHVLAVKPLFHWAWLKKSPNSTNRRVRNLCFHRRRELELLETDERLDASCWTDLEAGEHPERRRAILWMPNWIVLMS